MADAQVPHWSGYGSLAMVYEWPEEDVSNYTGHSEVLFISFVTLRMLATSIGTEAGVPCYPQLAYDLNDTYALV